LKYLIGVDIGTTGTKAAIYDEECSLIAESYRESLLLYPCEGGVEQNPDDFYTSACDTIHEMMIKSGISAKEVKSITIDGQMAGILGIDDNWNHVTNYDSWLDVRCSPYVDLIRRKGESRVMELSGLPSMVAHCAKMLWWKHERPEVYDSVKKFIMPAGYAAGRMAGLSGREAFIDHTYCHFTGLYDFQRNCWSEELCDEFGIAIEKLPEVVKPWHIVGNLTRQAAEDCGLTAGVPVTAGCGDQAAGFLGAGIVSKGSAIDVAGTASLFACCVDSFKPDLLNKTLLTGHAISDDLYFPQAYLSGGGLCLRWFRDNILKPNANGGDISYQAYDKKAESLGRRPTGILFTPYLGGRNFPFNGNLRGAFSGLNWSADSVTLYKAIMEGIAYEYYSYLKIEKSLYPEVKFDEVRSYGGGAGSMIFNRIKADVLGIPYVLLDRTEVGTLGSAILGGYAVGVFDDMAKAASQATHRAGTVEPDLANHKIYAEYAEVYSEQNSCFEKIHDRLYKINKLNNLSGR
jgi:xylulokinase